MRRDVRILLGTACLGTAVVLGEHVPNALSGMETFRVHDVEIRGARHLGDDAVIDWLDLDPHASIWGRTDVWAERLLRHPLVKRAQVSRRFPDGLLVSLTERTPIALAPTPTLEPVDAEGYRLPLDPGAHRLDLPVIHTRRLPPDGSRLVPEDVRLLVAEVQHLMTTDTAFLQLVSSVAWAERGAIVARWTEPRVEFLLPSQAPPERLREGLGALADAVSRSSSAVPVAIDLRFADQVVVRHRGP